MTQRSPEDKQKGRREDLKRERVAAQICDHPLYGRGW